MLNTTPKCIIVAADVDMQVYRGYWVQGLFSRHAKHAAAIRTVSLGGVWLGVHPIKERERKGTRKMFNLPGNIVYLLPLLHSECRMKREGPSDRYNPRAVPPLIRGNNSVEICKTPLSGR